MFLIIFLITTNHFHRSDGRTKVHNFPIASSIFLHPESFIPHICHLHYMNETGKTQVSHERKRWNLFEAKGGWRNGFNDASFKVCIHPICTWTRKAQLWLCMSTRSPVVVDPIPSMPDTNFSSNFSQSSCGPSLIPRGYTNAGSSRSDACTDEIYITLPFCGAYMLVVHFKFALDSCMASCFFELPWTNYRVSSVHAPSPCTSRPIIETSMSSKMGS